MSDNQTPEQANISLPLSSLSQDLPLPVSPAIDPETAYAASRAALTALELEVGRFPSALQNAVQETNSDLILRLRRRRLEAELELNVAQLNCARDLVQLYEARSRRAVASVSDAHPFLAHSERVLAEAQAMHQAALNAYQQSCSDRDFAAFDLRQARGQFAELTAQQMKQAAQSALRQRL